jgi:hypothetical protein
MVKLIGSADLPGLVTATSDALGIPPADIEKDIWVVEVLRSVFLVRLKAPGSSSRAARA